MATLSEYESKQLLARYGIEVVAEALVTTPDDAIAAADALGYPVVAKLCARGLAHKTERGLVRLGLRDGDAVAAATVDLLDRAETGDGDAAVLIAAQAGGTRELIAGAHRDAQFGPCVMLGVGGVLAEALADVAFRLVPITRVDAEEMIEDLRSSALLGPFRGEPPVDRGRLADVVTALAALVTDEPGVAAVDVNPLIVVDGRPIAVDALVEVA